MEFTLTHTDPQSNARAGEFVTDHGTVRTPVFMPVGTRAAVKALRSSDLRRLGAGIILGNTYHLHLRPGVDTLNAAGGLHRFMNWSGPILTDSGGYQVFSLHDLRRVSDQGVEFQSHIDGSRHVFTPESVVDTQRAIGSDITMVLDECAPGTSDYAHQKQAMLRSLRWAERARTHHLKTPALYGHRQFQFGIVQGGTHRDLRSESAARLVETGFEGYAIGGLAVGEPTESMYETVAHTAPELPPGQPRYLMGVGTPQDLLQSVARGIDMFDCVMPTRNARNGMVFTSSGRLNLRNAQYRDDGRPLDEQCDCETCAEYSRAYLRHLFNVGEITACVLATIHNIRFYLRLMETARDQILTGTYTSWMTGTLRQMRDG